LRSVLVLALCSLLTACASTRPSGLCASLRGAGPESDALDPDASGSARLEIVGQTVRFTFHVEGTGKIIASHIHRGAAGVNGPMAWEVNPGFAADRVSGTAEVPEELARDLAENPSAYYVKLHSLKFPGGAIRGQLGPCGEPSRGSR
jgi:CHRD domain-containing protein